MSQDIVARAIEKAGSARALARLMDKPDSTISNWKSGDRPVPEDALAWLAEYTGEDHVTVLAREKGGLWKKLATATAATVLISGSALPTEGYTKTIDSTNQLILYIM